MRLTKGLLVGLIAAGLAGCGTSAGPPAASSSSAAPATTGPTSAQASPSGTKTQAGAGAAPAQSTAGPTPAQAGAAGTKTQASPAGKAQASPAGSKSSARDAAAQYYSLYSASQFAASWDLLAPAAKHQVAKAVWVSVHQGCPSAGGGKARVIKFVTVFGNAAIVTQGVAGATTRREIEDVFNYVNGRWGYSPADLSIYHHGSVAADIAAAKAAGFCAAWKDF